MVRVYSPIAAQNALAAGVCWCELELLMHARGVDYSSVLQETLEVVGRGNVEPRHCAQRGIEHPPGQRLGDTSPETEHPREVYLTIGCDVERAIDWIVNRMLERIDGIAVVDELESRIEAEQSWHDGQCEISADRVANLRSKYRSKAQRCEGRIGMGRSRFADEAFHLSEVTLMTARFALRSRCLSEDRWITWAGAVDRCVGFDDHRSHGREPLDRTE